MTDPNAFISPGYINSITADNFTDRALDLFRLQYDANSIYRSYVDALGRSPDGVRALHEIPFLPVSFFKTHQVKTGTWDQPAIVFESSGTTGEIPARHAVWDIQLYHESLLQGFQKFYGRPSEYVILALLPSYLERGNSSLVHMAQTLMEYGGFEESGFYLDDWQRLAETLAGLESAGRKTLLLGVTFALIDFAEAYPMSLKHTIVMETGGMKGRKEEWTRVQVHEWLRSRWQLPQIHSEYGMTELLSQAYAVADGRFRCSDSMRVMVREMNDPLDVMEQGSGVINIIDLANVHSCAFLATDDIGNLAADGSFEVLGRLDHSSLRGCSLMAI